MLEKAYHLARDAHEGQYRKSGEPYIIHPLKVAILLAELELDMESIVAGLLHDVIEDTDYTYEDISEIFSPEIALIVDGVTKLGKISYSTKEEVQAENYRKMFIAMAKDIRVILIKLADRLHNMRTLNFMTPEKQKEKAQETMDIYAPLANRLGISKIKTEMEDLCLKYLDNDGYQDLKEKISLKKTEREAYVEGIVNDIKAKMEETGIEGSVDGRTKHFFSIYKKMRNKNRTFDQIYDLFAVRVIVDSVKDCYAVLGLVHEMYKPMPGRFKDYIAMPKANMYQSLHNTMIGPGGEPFEIQIRTWEMHRTAEYGIAAHWKYKEGKAGEKNARKEEQKLTWLRRILEWQMDMSDDKEFISTIKQDLNIFDDQVYCFTPMGDVISLPNGSTPIDFAYYIHTAIGNKMVGARVNNKIVTFDYKLQNGDRVDIITSQNSKGPSRDWLNLVKSSQARTKINNWFKKEFKEDNIIKGKELFEKDAKKKGYNVHDLLKPEWVKIILEKFGFKDWDALCAAIGHGGLKEGVVTNRFIEEVVKERKKNLTPEEIIQEMEEVNANRRESRKSKYKSGVRVKGIGDVNVRFSKCCNPVPGDEIIGFITRGRGVSIHRTDCVNIINLNEFDRHRLIETEWDIADIGETEANYSSEIKIYAEDRSGLILDIARILSDEDMKVRSINGRSLKDQSAIFNVVIDISSKDQLEKISNKLRGIKGVSHIERVSG
ncbi:MAG: bifunctional (p)ppGpp synthetase/guanosine-3',5'-bis(diphosphate) 3'-pyrophosphohydrolase [Firmicutes bacterium]|nr:bifunctional (p)ppGpp synthetase/guanosine-3',5'-bis(diphosphate) 3'-pyrophosphohydrolase [Bacillota bacterium]MBR2593050.1 bifunctional (p)ppGpp synthetase/guanosine-3',5'-bis(diphosphate) 3'-pyrophosphohydrolase [Bacillota bacterium]